MAIDYEPKGLEGVVNGPYAEKRLKNRDASVTATQQGEVVWQEEGALLPLHERALLHMENNPCHDITFIEFRCTSLMVSSNNPQIINQ